MTKESKKLIIDISHHQNPKRIDYGKLCSQLDMAIIRVQYGSKTIDRHYKTHIAQMKKHNVPFGVYAWVRGISKKDMQIEAQDFYNRVKNLTPQFYALDVEEKSMSDMRTGINAYVEKLRSLTNKKIGLYVAHHLYPIFNLDTSKFDFIWIPRYGTNNGKAQIKPAYPCDLWQYTSVGNLEGYSGNLDLNRIIGNKSLSYFTHKKSKEVKPMKNIFKDVDNSRWSTPYIKAGKKLGVIEGTGNGNFNPTEPLTREQGAVLIVRLYEKITGKKVVK